MERTVDLKMILEDTLLSGLESKDSKISQLFKRQMFKKWKLVFIWNYIMKTSPWTKYYIENQSMRQKSLQYEGNSFFQNVYLSCTKMKFVIKL